eukprot:Colp12_sorted_trinity150504_noHs@21258
MGPQHGFARIAFWEVNKGAESVSDSEVVCVLELKDSDETRKYWSPSFKLQYIVTLTPSAFSQRLVVHNTDEDEFDFTSLLHTYFRCPDVTKVSVSNFHNLHYSDKADGYKTKVEHDEPVHVTAYTDRVYSTTPANHVITNLAGGHSIRLQKTNFPDTVLWNPWVENAKAMADFGDEEYPNMICVEAGAVAERVKLGPGNVWEASQTLELLV